MSEEEKKDDIKGEDIEEKKDGEYVDKDPVKEDFEKESDTVPASKYNQILRKQREAEARIKELESSKVVEDDDEEEDKEEDKEEEKEVNPLKAEIDEIKARLSKQETDERKKARALFFDAHNEYLNDAEKWQELLDEMDNSINPNSKDDYFTQLEKAHRIIAGGAPNNVDIDTKKREMASDTHAGDDGGKSGDVTEEFTAEDRAYMKEWNISEDGMRAFKKKQESGSMRIL